MRSSLSIRERISQLDSDLQEKVRNAPHKPSLYTGMKRVLRECEAEQERRENEFCDKLIAEHAKGHPVTSMFKEWTPDFHEPYGTRLNPCS